MKAKEVYIIQTNEDFKNPDFIVAYSTEHDQFSSVRHIGGSDDGPVDQARVLQFGGRFTLRTYAIRFAQLLKDGGA